MSPKTLEKVFSYCLDNEGIEFDEDSISPPLVESHEIQQISGMSLNNLGSTDPEMDKARNGDDSGALPDDRPIVLLVEDNPVNLKVRMDHMTILNRANKVCSDHRGMRQERETTL